LGNSSTVDGLYPHAFDSTTFGATITPVPEPGTWVLLGSALLGLLFYVRRRR